MKPITPRRALDQASGFHPELEERLAEHFGERRPIRRIRRRLCPYTSSFHIDELDVRFRDGSVLKLVMKDLSRKGMLEAARRARPDFVYEPLREIKVYRSILPHAPPGTATAFGAEISSRAGRYSLLLENVGGLQLSQVGSFAIWEQAAAWIARFHRSFSPTRAEQLVKRSNLLIYDERFYWHWMERAQRFARQPYRRSVIDRIARRYAPIVKRLTTMPRTVIHGELYACNVIVGSAARRRVRICPVDWEMAAHGPNLIDLASLTAGWPGHRRRALARAYLGGSSEPVEPQRRPRLSADFGIDLDCCRLHLAVRMLGWSDSWTPPPQHARDWLVEAARLSDRLHQVV
jgi:Phosphotransferase enzyme family